MLASAAAWSWCECTPPGETRPMRWQAPPDVFKRAIRSVSAGARSISWLATARLIRGNSCITTRPAPILRCPTSELPICPSGRPTSSPDVCSRLCGQLPHRRSNTGVFACSTALSAGSSRHPQPSRMTSITGRRCCIFGFHAFGRDGRDPSGSLCRRESARVVRDYGWTVNQRNHGVVRRNDGDFVPGYAATLPASQPRIARLRVRPQ